MTIEDISVSNVSLKKLFEESFYTIDFYQREYAWGEEEVRTLVTDLRDAFLEGVDAAGTRRKPEPMPQYFLGPFVYYERGDNVRSLVDGQQRFTTLHLIFMTLRSISIRLNAQGHTEMLTSVIRNFDERSKPRYRIGDEERTKVLNAIYEDRQYEGTQADSLSVRNLWRRSQDIEPMLREVPAESYTRFIEWLLNRVVMVGIRASDSNNAFRIFESMNDRGARLTAVDLLKSYLLANVGEDEDKLNHQWRHMLAELTTVRDDRSAPGHFLKAALQARYARLDDEHDDMAGIESALNLWVRRNEDHLGLRGRPDRFHAFVEELLRLATFYRTFLHASRTLQDGLEALYFNAKNSLDSQMIAIFAAVRADDILVEAKDKARRIAAYIDRWYVLRILSDLPVQQRDLMEAISALLPGLRRCRTTDDVSAVLAAQLQGEEREYAVLEGFGLRGTNRGQVKYLLARLTAFVQQGCGQHGEVPDYLSDTRPYQIEHLFANKPERHRDEIPDALRFRSLRNQLGGLVLLPDKDNASLGAMPYDEKIELYGRHNVLVGVLDQRYHRRFPGLREFVKAHKVESCMRSFGTKTPMATIVQTRQELYLRLCSKIWSFDHMGLSADDQAKLSDPFLKPEADEVAPPPRKIRLRTDVARMVAAGVIQPGTRIVLTYLGFNHWAQINDEGRITLEGTGGIYSKIDEAGAFVRETRTCDGMGMWCVTREDGEMLSLRALRDQAVAAGVLAGRRM
ncbi:DUF262 domain-containing protein [Streptosporangium sp. NPDC049046]|uniref:GmrSD restriction endonuclease domain-containing protein n=1 Tax=unclassified Streptosporangium TaxID=2632669 RepID=UPI00341BE2C6